MEIKWIEYKGKNILLCDYRGAKSDKDMIDHINQFADMLRQQTGRTLSLSNYENTVISTAFMVEAKKLGTEVGLVKMGKSALLGVTGLKKIMLKSYNTITGQKDNRMFETEEEAKEWLVS